MPNTKTTVFAKNIGDLRAEAGRSRIVDAAVSHLERDNGIRLADADTALSWGLDFTLHLNFDEAERAREVVRRGG